MEEEGTHYGSDHKQIIELAHMLPEVDQSYFFPKGIIEVFWGIYVLEKPIFLESHVC